MYQSAYLESDWKVHPLIRFPIVTLLQVPSGDGPFGIDRIGDHRLQETYVGVAADEVLIEGGSK